MAQTARRGAGHVELLIADRVRDGATSVEGRAQLAAEAFADAVDVLPRTLAANAGRDPIDALVELRAANESGRASSRSASTARSRTPSTRASSTPPPSSERQSRPPARARR